MRPMTRIFLSLAAVAFAATASTTATAGASSFKLIDGTGKGVSQVAIRRAGTSEWKPLGPPGQIQFNDPDCAFDIQASVPGAGAVTWAGVNLCEVKSVTLKRDETAGAWVDYDE